ncbi:hypothetical protein [Agrococcus sp. ARC_14]|uniref:hypothetical protein n=1 Tax=Agrococcus sp. ARC_14 TaxID=2919927 RepID=UPI001F060A5A|nr:hypothetical protein [Agrococcus sp. ARC_14]MCH1882055.1 hypothetical protein [Agrococcus sp. ARC_14]
MEHLDGGQGDRLRPIRTSEILAADPWSVPERDDGLARIRRGFYVDSRGLESATPESRYCARIAAVAAARDHPTFALESALALHGVPFGEDPALVFTAGDTRTAGKKAGVSHSRGELDPGDVTHVGGLLVCSLPYALADVARRRDPLVAVAAIDNALRSGAVQREALLEALDRQGRRGRAAATWAIGFADAAAESVGESYSRVRIHQLGFAPPQLQPWVTGRSGKRYRPDMRWEFAERRPLLGEFDGMVKYGELADREGRKGAQALAVEKAREDDLRFAADMLRWVWADVMQPARLERLLLAHAVPRLRPASPALRSLR